MQLKLFQFVLAIFIAAMGTQKEMGSEKSEPLSYRLLKSSQHQFGEIKAANYDVSVDRFLNRQQIEKLICRVIGDENPTSLSTLSISIFFKLDKMFATGGLRFLEKELLDRLISEYSWISSLPEKKNRLLIRRDAQGNVAGFQSFYDFDHTRDCK